MPVSRIKLTASAVNVNIHAIGGGGTIGSNVVEGYPPPNGHVVQL